MFVDFDFVMMKLFLMFVLFVKLNQGVLKDLCVYVINDDVVCWFELNVDVYDVIVVDFFDLINFGFGCLYLVLVFWLLVCYLLENGYMVIQLILLYFVLYVYWIIIVMLYEVGFNMWLYYCYVLLFGDWGFVIVGKCCDFMVLMYYLVLMCWFDV